MDTLDRCIRDLIPAHPKRSGPSGRRFGAEVPGNPGFVASLKHGRGARDARGEASRKQGSWLLRGSICLPVFLLCQWTISRIANSSIPEPWTCRSNAPRLSRAEDGTGMGKTRNGCPAAEQAAAHPGSSPRTLERYRVRGGEPGCVSCCSRMRDLRCGLDGRIAGDGRPVAAGSDDSCGREGRKIATGENKFFVVAQRRQAYACHLRSSQEYSEANITA